MAFRLLPFTLLVVLAGACDGSPSVDAGSDAGTGVRIDMAWRVRCLMRPATCDYPDRSVMGMETEETSHTCNVVETATTRTLSFGATLDESTSVIVNRATFPRAGGSPIGAEGEILFREADGVWIGALGPDSDPIYRLCDIAITFTRDLDGPLISGEMSCANAVPFVLLGERPPDLERDLTAPGDGAAAMEPVRFALHGCRGYTPD